MFNGADYEYRYEFNCGGYAFDTFDWYLPYSWEFDIDHDLNEENREKVMEEWVECMLKDFEGRLRVVQNEKDVAESERLILFRSRLTPNTDFHYVVRKGRNFFHKLGCTPEFRRIKKEEVFSDEWPFGYDGPIVMMAYRVP